MAKKKSSKRVASQQKAPDADIQRMGVDLIDRSHSVLAILNFIERVGQLASTEEERRWHEATTAKLLKKLFLGIGKAKVDVYFKQLMRFVELKRSAVSQ